MRWHARNSFPLHTSTQDGEGSIGWESFSGDTRSNECRILVYAADGTRTVVAEKLK
jgi:hypothetical protein